MFAAGNACLTNPTMHLQYTVLNMIIGNLKKIGVGKKDIVIIAVDFHGEDYSSWRKLYSPEYKAGRKGLPPEYYEKLNILLGQIDKFSNFHIIIANHCEADDVMACFSGQTYIASPLKNRQNRIISKLKIGDKVYSYNLKKNKIELSTITETHKRIVNEIKIVHFDNGTKVKVTENHRFYTTKNQWVAVKNLKVGNEIYYLNSTQPNNKYVLLKPKIKGSHNSYRLGYLCGAIEGDGHLNIKRNNIQFNINDIDFVNRIKKYTESIFHYKFTFTKKEKTYRILIGNKIIFDIIKEYIDNRDGQNNSFVMGFIAGMFDSEGCLKQKKGQLAMNISNTNKSLIDFISSKLKVEHNIIKQKQQYNKQGKKYKIVYLIKIQKQLEIIKFFTLYKPAIVRKYPNFKEYAQYLHNGRTITKIETKTFKRKQGAVYNLTVEPNNNYFAHNLLVHNCACRYYKDKEVILCTSDSDLHQMWEYPNVKIFSPHRLSKRYKMKPVNFNVQKFILENVNKNHNNIVNPLLCDQDHFDRLKCVNLLKLPDFVETPIIAELDNLEEKENHLDLIPYPKIKERFDQIYGEGSEPYEKSVKYYERKEKAKQKKKAYKKRR